MFKNAETVEIDFDLPNAVPTNGKEEGMATAAWNKKNTAIDTTNRLRKERFLWSLLQVHAILCTSMVDRTALARPGSVVATGQFLPLVVWDGNRRELQYISMVNGFLANSPILCSLLDRQSNHQ